MDDSSRSYEPTHRLAIEQFNQGQFHASHQTWELLWQADRTGPNADFFKGLIQAAMALYHLTKGNFAGARKLVDRAAGYLAAFGPRHLGLNVDDFLCSLAECMMAAAKHRSSEYDSSAALRFPKIVLRDGNTSAA